MSRVCWGGAGPHWRHWCRRRVGEGGKQMARSAVVELQGEPRADRVEGLEDDTRRERRVRAWSSTRCDPGESGDIDHGEVPPRGGCRPREAGQCGVILARARPGTRVPPRGCPRMSRYGLISCGWDAMPVHLSQDSHPAEKSDLLDLGNQTSTRFEEFFHAWCPDVRPRRCAGRGATGPADLKPTDAIIRLPATCICGADLWPYRGVRRVNGPSPMGHE